MAENEPAPGLVHQLDIVLPCLNEAMALPWLISRIPAGAKAIVVDNGSSDGSADLAAELGALVVHASQRGYGAACHAGLTAATARYVAFCDCDASVDPSDVLGLLALVKNGADLAVGQRRPTTRSSWPLHARIANRILARRIRTSLGLRITDVGPLRVGERTALIGLDLQDRRSGYPVETIVAAARAGWQVVGSDIDYHPRAGRSKVTGTVRGTLHAIQDMSQALR